MRVPPGKTSQGLLNPIQPPSLPRNVVARILDIREIKRTGKSEAFREKPGSSFIKHPSKTTFPPTKGEERLLVNDGNSKTLLNESNPTYKLGREQRLPGKYNFFGSDFLLYITQNSNGSSS
eukprot:Sdes_comp23002_c0_seq1m21345